MDPSGINQHWLTHELMLHGGSDSADKRVRLTAGNLSMFYDKGSLRYISNGRTEVLRMIYFALRNMDWLTIVPEISDENLNVNGNEFIITYKAEYQSGEIHFRAFFSIEGKNDNTVIFSFEGEALSSFMKNRIGFCLLHPSDHYAGKPCSIIHTDGTAEGTVFPEMISPHQPFMNIRSMSWQTGGDIYTADFQGDIFETEDQRNWTDTSFKTYSGPLSIPFPTRIEKGSVIAQKIILKGENISLRDSKNLKRIIITIEPENGKKMPPVGISSSTRPQPLTDGEIKVLRSIQFDHYRVEIFPDSPHWQSRADTLFNEAERLILPLELVIFFDNNARVQLLTLRDWLSGRKNEIAVILIFHKNEAVTPGWLSELVIPGMRELCPGARIGIGTNASFVEINRVHPGNRGNDMICYSVHPQEHSSDNLTLVENLSGQAATAASATGIADDKGVWISPVTIQRRFNPNREFYEIPFSGIEFPPQVDIRLLSLFGACWTAGSLKNLLESEVSGVTYFEAAGERGILQGEYDSRWPSEFPVSGGMVFPVFFVFRFLLLNKKLKLLRTLSSDSHSAECLTLSDGRKLMLMMFNYTAEKRDVTISGCTGLLRIRTLSLENYSEAAWNSKWTGAEKEYTLSCTKTLSMEPFSLKFIEARLWR
jgi:D-apionolactonase